MITNSTNDQVRSYILTNLSKKHITLTEFAGKLNIHSNYMNLIKNPKFENQVPKYLWLWLYRIYTEQAFDKVAEGSYQTMNAALRNELEDELVRLGMGGRRRKQKQNEQGVPADDQPGELIEIAAPIIHNRVVHTQTRALPDPDPTIDEALKLMRRVCAANGMEFEIVFKNKLR